MINRVEKGNKSGLEWNQWIPGYPVKDVGGRRGCGEAFAGILVPMISSDERVNGNGDARIVPHNGEVHVQWTSLMS